MAENKNESGVKAIKEYFGMNAKDFMADWKKLTPEDKAELRAGIEDKSLTY